MVVVILCAPDILFAKIRNMLKTVNALILQMVCDVTNFRRVNFIKFVPFKRFNLVEEG